MSSLDDRFIVISKKGEENLILNWIDFEGKTVKEIREKYLSENQNLSITNNLYSELLNNSEKPSELYPQLAITQYPDQYLTPENYLSIIENDSDFSIKFQIVCQEKEPKINFPPLDISFKRSNFLNCEDIFKYVSEKLTFSHFDDKFFQDSTEISPDISPTDFFENSKRSPIYFHTTFADSALKKVNYRQNILKEIISTETTYVNDLRALIDYWKPGLKRTNYFTDQEISFFFGDLPDILKLHAKFKESLEKRGTEYKSLVSDIFLKFSTSFAISKRFISTYAIFTYILNEKAQTNKNSSAILHNLSKMNTFEEDRDLTSYLITPVQRMPRYMLFLRELLKYSPPEHPDFQFVEKAMKSIVSVTQDIDLFSNSSRQIAQIMTNFSKPLFIFKEGRKLIENATVYVSQSPVPFDPYSTGTLQTITAPKEGYFYLFNDSVLMTTIDQISSPKSKDSPSEFSKYPENPLFLKDLQHFKYFPHQDSIEFSFKDKRAKRGVNHFLIYFKRRTDCFDFLEKLENQRMGLKTIDNSNPWILWKNKFFDLRPKINSKQLNKPIKFTKILPSAYTQGCTASTFTEGSELLHFFFGGESREKTNGQLVTIKDDGSLSFEIDSIENNSPNIHSRSGHSLCSDGKDIYVFGGKKSNYDFFDDLWKYEPDTKKWQLLNPHQEKPTKRAYHCCCFYQSPSTNKKTITIFGGLGEKKKIFDDICVFDIDTCEWAIYDLFNSPTPRYLMASCVCNESQFIVVGGRDERYVFNDVYSFDLAHKMWKKIVVNGETVFPRFGHKVLAVGDWVVAVGGTSFDEVYVDHSSTRVKENERDTNGTKHTYTFPSLPPTAINIKTGKSFNVDEFGNAPQSFVGFGIVQCKNSGSESKDKSADNDVKEEQNNEADSSNATSNSNENNSENKEKESDNKNSNENIETNNENKENVSNNNSNEDKTNASNENNNNEDKTNARNDNNNSENDDDYERSISRFLVFGGFEDGLNASRNTWFTIDIPNNLTELIEGPIQKPIESDNKAEKENENEEQKAPEIQLPITNEVVSNTEEIIHVNISEKLNDQLERESLLISQKEQESTEDESKEQENGEQIHQPEKGEIEDKENKEKEEEEEIKQQLKAKEEQIPEPIQKVTVSDQDKDNNAIKKQETEIKEKQQKEGDEETQKIEKKTTEEAPISQETVSSATQQKENNKSEEEVEKVDELQHIKKEENKQDEENEVAKKEVARENENETQPTKVIQSEDEQKQQLQDQKSPEQINEKKDQQIKSEEQDTTAKKQKEDQEEEESKQQISSPKQNNEKETKEKQQNLTPKQNNAKETNKEQQDNIQKQDNTKETNKEQQANSQKQNNAKEVNKEQQTSIQKQNNAKETNKEQQIQTPKANQAQQSSSQKQSSTKENKEHLIQTPKSSQAQQIRSSKPINEKEKQQVQAPKINQREQVQAPKANQQNEKLAQKQQPNQQRNLNQKKTQPQNSQRTQRKSTEPSKSAVNAAAQKKPVQSQKQNQQQTQKQPPKYQKRQTLEPTSLNQTNAANHNKNNSNNAANRKPQQGTARRKTTFYEDYLTKRLNETKNNAGKQEAKNGASKPEASGAVKTTAKARPVRASLPATKPAESHNNSNKTQQARPAQKPAAAQRDAPSSVVKGQVAKSVASKQATQKTKKTQLHSEAEKQQQTRPPPAPPAAEEDSIFDFQQVIGRKLASFHSNSTSIGSQTQESQQVFRKPEMSEEDAAFVAQLGIELANLDLFSRKLVSRRLRHAVESGTGSITNTKRLESAFVVSFTANANKDDENGNEADENLTFTEIGVDESVSLLASRMQALTDKSGKSLFVCSFDVPFDAFKKAVMEKD